MRNREFPGVSYHRVAEYRIHLSSYGWTWIVLKRIFWSDKPKRKSLDAVYHCSLLTMYITSIRVE